MLIDSIIEEDEEKPQNHRNQRRWKMFKYHALLAADKTFVTGRQATSHKHTKLLAIRVNRHIVGYLRTPDRQATSNKFDQKFNYTMKKWFLLLFTVALVFTLLLSWPISGYFTRPIRRLNDHVKKMSQGQYGQMITIKRADELGRLAGNINHLSQTLKANNENQNIFFTDISHELRTPVAVLRAQIEALQDGVQEANERHLNQLHQQVMTLSLLINDIQDLAGTELGSMQYKKQNTDLSQLLTVVVDAFSSKVKASQLTLKQNIEEDIWVNGDSLRLRQLFNNIMNNAVRYTDAGGVIKISMNVDKQQAIIQFEDSTPSVDKQHHAQLFERLFRPDTSRNKDQGGFGIGLAIAKNIVAAHEGSIQASDSSLGGLRITVSLPIAENRHE